MQTIGGSVGFVALVAFASCAWAENTGFMREKMPTGDNSPIYQSADYWYKGTYPYPSDACCSCCNMSSAEEFEGDDSTYQEAPIPGTVGLNEQGSQSGEGKFSDAGAAWSMICAVAPDLYPEDGSEIQPLITIAAIHQVTYSLNVVESIYDADPNMTAGVASRTLAKSGTEEDDIPVDYG